MMRAWLLMLSLAPLARADVLVERATVAWSELEVMLRKEGVRPPPRAAPRAYSVPSLQVSGDLENGRAELPSRSRWRSSPIAGRWRRCCRRRWRWPRPKWTLRRDGAACWCATPPASPWPPTGRDATTWKFRWRARSIMAVSSSLPAASPVGAPA